MRSLECFRKDLRYDIGFYVVLVGIFITLALVYDQRTFSDFVSKMVIGSALSIAIGLIVYKTDSEPLHICLFLVLLSSLGGIHLDTNDRCLAWAAQSAEDPVTGQCRSFVYGGCGPTPEPWYYEETCSSESQERMCSRLESSNNEEDRKKGRWLCTDYPDFNMTLVRHNLENETLKVRVTENEFNYYKKKKFAITIHEDMEIRIEHDGELYNTSNLIAKNETSVFNDSMNIGDEFTIVYDGIDRDGDGRKGADFEHGDLWYHFEWSKTGEKEGTHLGSMRVSKKDGLEYSQMF